MSREFTARDAGVSSKFGQSTGRANGTLQEYRSCAGGAKVFLGLLPRFYPFPNHAVLIVPNVNGSRLVVDPTASTIGGHLVDCW